MVVVSVGCVGVVDPVVSIGVVVTVSVVVEGVVIVESLAGGADVSEPVVLSGVSQPTVAIAKKAMKRMLFMSVYFKVK